MKRHSKYIHEAAKKEIEAAIHKAEAMTSGEIAFLIVPSSGRYRWVALLWAAMGWVTISVALLVIELASPFPFSTWKVVLLQTLGSAAFAILSNLPAVRRFTIPQIMRQKRAERESLANFLAMGLTETKDRNAVLVYLSEAEHEVVVLADSGIHKKVGQAGWDKIAAEIAIGFRNGRGPQALCDGILNIGQALAQHFPYRQGDVDEIPNEVKFGQQDRKPEKP